MTNDFGIEWLRRHLGDDYRVHVLDFEVRREGGLRYRLPQLSAVRFLFRVSAVPGPAYIYHG